MTLVCACSAAALLVLAASAAAEPLPIGKSRALQLALSHAYEFDREAPFGPEAVSAIEAGGLRFGVRQTPRDVWGPALLGRDGPKEGLALEFSVAAEGPGDLGVAIARRTRNEQMMGANLRAEGGELRLGQRLSIDSFASPSWDAPTWYLFAASDGEALTWTPAAGAVGRRGGLRLQDERVMVGDIQAGVSVEASNLQASLSFIQREVSNGQRSENQNYAGVSLTWRR